uniref:ABC transporter domain-containing protein n=1 Tax=Emiliania huxleyi TaxID=2903 RepID=A0A7S3TIF7_EMIHU
MLFDVPVHELTAGDGDKALLTADGGRNRGHGADFGHLKNRLRLRSGGRYAMIGRNGCGKSTLLRALASGTLPEWPGSIRTFLVEQDHRIDPEQQVIEAVLSADSRVSDLQAEAARLERESAEARESATERLCEIYEALEELDAESEGLRRHRVEAILGGLGFTAEMQGAAVGELSGGWQARLAMASALFVEPELLLLDEPTNHLDLRGLRWLQRYLRDEFRGTMLVVAHDRAFLDAVATDIILFEGVKGTLTYFHGTLEEFETRTADSSAAMQRQVAALERKKKHIEQSVDKMKQAAAGKHGDQKKSDLVASREKKLGRMGLEKTADGKKFNAQKHGIRAGAANHNDGESKGSGTMRKMVGTSLLPKSAPELKWGFGDSAPLGLSDDAPLLELRSVGFAYPGGGQPTLFSGVELSLGSRCRVALVGRNGTGKSSLMRLLTGEAEPSAGEVWRHRGLRVAHYSQHLAESLDKEARSGCASSSSSSLHGTFSDPSHRRRGAGLPGSRRRLAPPGPPLALHLPNGQPLLPPRSARTSCPTPRTRTSGASWARLASTAGPAGWPPSPSRRLAEGSACASSSRAWRWRRRISCCSTSRPTTSTSTRSTP